MFASYDQKTKTFLKQLSDYNTLNLAPNTIKAANLVIKEMSKEKGFQRHDGQDYFVHPIAVAQMAIDFNLARFCYGTTTKQEIEINEKTDNLLASCLLHDLLEDVDWVTPEFIIENFNSEIYKIVDNVTKKNEPIENYLKRVTSNETSALVKVLDRLNNVSTLSNSSLKHREKQLKSTRDYYIPMIEFIQVFHFEHGSFYSQVKYIISSLLDEVERGVKFEKLSLKNNSVD